MRYTAPTFGPTMSASTVADAVNVRNAITDCQSTSPLFVLRIDQLYAGGTTAAAQNCGSPANRRAAVSPLPPNQARHSQCSRSQLTSPVTGSCGRVLARVYAAVG